MTQKKTSTAKQSRLTVQFRVDEETMLRLQSISDAKKTPLGVLVRMWSVERMTEEERNLRP